MASKGNQNHTLSGRITNLQNEPLGGLTVRAFDQDPKTAENPLGQATTDAEGRYKIDFTEENFRIGGVESGGPDVFIRVFEGDRLLGESQVKRNAKKQITIDLPIDYVVKNDPNEPKRRVFGVVRDMDGDHLVNVTVHAFDQDLRSEQSLGKTQTDKQGFYQIFYTASQFRRAEKESADLAVRVFDANGALLAESQIVFNAPQEAEVNLTIIDNALPLSSLFEKIKRDIHPLLGTLKIAELEEDGEHRDLSFLAGETRFEKDVLACFVLAHKLAEQAIRPEFWFAVLCSSFYKYSANESLAGQLNTILNRLISLGAGAVRKALSRSFTRSEISRSLEDEAEQWVAAFLNFIAARTVSEAGEPTLVKSALDDAGIKDVKRQEKFARLFNEHRSFTSELLGALGKDRSFSKSEIANLHTSFELANLTQGDFRIVKAIKDQFAVCTLENIRALAKKREDEWVALLESAELPDAKISGTTLERQFREAFPTTAFAGGLERALENGGSHGLRHAETFGRFLGLHENFELLTTPVDDFLENSVDPDFREAAADESFKLEVKAVQRVFKLAPTFEATDALLANDLHSAQQVYRMGESEFIRNYEDQPGFTAETARIAWNRAADTYAGVLTVVAELKTLDNGALPMAVKNPNGSELSAFPNWDNLFKTGDLCECEHCNSVLGPAAYYADLLMFLKERRAKNNSFTAKDILFARRRDLGFVELNCENAITPLPYVDVVCEVLEDAVDTTGENDLLLVGLTSIPADPATAKTAVANAFANAFADSVNDGKEKIGLGADFTLSQVDPSDPDRWVAHGDDVTYLLKKKTSSNSNFFFGEILRNTKASAAQLRAFPQYVNPKAYKKLREAKYPLTLPFDLAAEEVRAAFQQTNLQRWDLMRTLHGANAPNNPSEGEIAAEYFGISISAKATDPSEKRLILEADPTDAGQQEIWGETESSWLNTVGNVKMFLLKTGLEYNELLALLDLKFIDPKGDIDINHVDDFSCDTAKKFINVLDSEKLDRIHRFLRLWRKLKGWEMWELGLALRVLRDASTGDPNGDLDESFLIKLMYFRELRNKLGSKATVEKVLALFDDLNTETHFTKSFEKRADGLYQNLFLNKNLAKPLETAFEVANVNVSSPTTNQITTYQPIVLAALGIQEADLILLKEIIGPSGSRYITDDLTLKNLSFLWRHAWLSKILKFKPEDWKVLLQIFGQDLLQFANPKAGLEFLEKIEFIRASGFTPDELNWLLAGDRSAKTAIKETDAARFLLALRRELQGIRAEYDPGRYDSLNGTQGANADELTALLASLLQKLNREQPEVNFFLRALRGRVVLESNVSGLPTGFAFPVNITAGSNNIPIQYNNNVFRFTGLMTSAQRTVLLNSPALATLSASQLQAYRNGIDERYEQSRTAATNFLFIETKIALPNGIALPPNLPSIPIRYDNARQVLSFTGVMTAAEQTALKAVTLNAAASDAIDELFELPRLAVKFYEPIFEAPLEVLPSAVHFGRLPPDLAARVSYDPEQRLLRFNGIMTKSEQAALDALVPALPSPLPSPLPAEAALRVAYLGAVESLAEQPKNVMAPDERVWLIDSDLDAGQSASDTFAKRLSIAAKKALQYLSKTLAANAVIQQSSAQLGLTEAMTRRLLTHYAVLLPETLLTRLTGTFAATIGVVDYATQSTTFEGWFWATRVAAIWKKWKITLEELETILDLTAGARLLDFIALPLNAAGANAAAANGMLEKFLRTGRLFKMRDSLAEGEVTLLQVLKKLSSGAYTAAAREKNPTGTTTQLLTIEKRLFAIDVQRLNEVWFSDDVEVLTNSLDIAYPTDYLLAESWERLRRAFYFLGNLNAGADTVKTFASAAMTPDHAKTINELLRSKFGADIWLELGVEIQDVLRECKRDALAAYLLTQRKLDTPTGKWENTNDLYAFYLLDVEMSSCQLTSRLVQASGSVQLFVQRCFMGLEPDVAVDADADSAWSWWQWMRKFRVWEANRKVFLWPENWIEPELKKDRSQFFKDLENELLQNEVDQYTVETALQNYLEKLDGVAQLEIAGFYQEDDGDNVIVHVFGRTPGAEPHLYYYRTYDYRQWSPWEKVDLDIQEDYLIPAVVNKRLYLFWPVFTEVPDEAKNGGAITLPKTGDGSFTPDRVQKRLRLQMAVSEYRQGKWTPKKVSTDFSESEFYDYEIVRKCYRFFIDRSDLGGDFCIRYDGFSMGNPTTIAARNAAALAQYKNEIDKATLKRDEAFQDKEKARVVRDAISEAHRLLSIDHDEKQRYLDHLVRLQGSIGHLRPFAAIEALKNLGVLRLDNVQETLLAEALKIENDIEKEFQKKPRNIGEEIAKAAALTALALLLAPFELAILPLKAVALIALEIMIGDARGARDRAKTAMDEAKGILDPAQTKLNEAQGKLNAAQAELDRIAPPNLFINQPLANFSPGCFEIFGCKGVPELVAPSLSNGSAISPANQPEDSDLAFLKWVKRSPENGFALNPGSDVLKETTWIFKIAPPWHLPPIDSNLMLPFFYSDKRRTFFVQPSIEPERSVTGAMNTRYQSYNPNFSEFSMTPLFHFKNFYHPFICDFAKQVYNPLKGIPSLMSRETQLKDTGFSFEYIYQPTGAVVKLPPQYPSLPDCYPDETVDFSPDGAYSAYNWEIFFHAPLLIANSLSKNQRFEKARDWYHYIFNPIGVESRSLGGSPTSKYWITKPFFEATKPHYAQQRIDNIMRMLAGDTNAPGYTAQAKKDLEDQVLDWRTNPFEPHRIANYRTVAYQKTVAMKYLDNLIAWGDNLFRQDSMESINEATQLYILAAEILGPRPKKIPPRAKPPVESFNELEKQFDKFSNAMVEVENLVPPMPGNGPNSADPAPLPMLYFCIPQNDRLLSYWDTVADRLYKIRHCMNIEGAVRQLALFEPPIDPAALVKAVAGGVDINAALADLAAPLPIYRFNVLLQKANEVCSDVKTLGGALLAALEKKDAEGMGLLRQTQEIRLLEAVKAIREKQIEEAKENLEGLKNSKVVIETRRNYYREIEKIIAGEQLSLDKLATAHTHQDKAQEINIAASVLGYLPNITIGASGFGGSPHVNVQWGTGNIISALQAASGSEMQLSSIAGYDANRAATLAGYDRRFSDWKLQERLAEKELDQMDKQIASAELRIAIAEKELENHVIQIENSKATDDFMRSKYTNQELYQWQMGQISGVYFQSYKLAYDLAKRAERCFRFELGLADSSFINFGYWDSLKKGLLAGEKLQYDLRRLEAAHIEQNRREFELTKHISLAMLDPLALLKLRETGRCFLRLPEEIFDLDYPGHYFRRIKSVSLTLPCVVGPYTTISCTLRLLKNSIRVKTTTGTNNRYERNTNDGFPSDDDRFVENNIPVKAIAASSGQNDSGVFELSFRDERYLPFEGAGAVSEWSLELFSDLPSNNPDQANPDYGKALRQFDYNSISDAILHIKYTAREDAGPFKNRAVKHLRNYFEQDGATPSVRMFNLRQEFPTAWHRFLNPVDLGDGNVLDLEMNQDLFPFRDKEKTLTINRLWLLARCKKNGIYNVVMTPALSTQPPGSNNFALTSSTQFGGLHFNAKENVGVEIDLTNPPATWQLKMTGPSPGNLQAEPAEVEDMLLVLGYQWSV